MKLINLLKEAFIDAQGKLQDFETPSGDKLEYVTNAARNAIDLRDFASNFNDPRTAHYRTLDFMDGLMEEEWEERVANNRWGTNKREEKKLWDKFMEVYFTPRVAQQLYKLLSDLL